MNETGNAQPDNAQAAEGEPFTQEEMAEAESYLPVTWGD